MSKAAHTPLPWQKSRFVDKPGYSRVDQATKDWWARDEAQVIRGPGTVGESSCNMVAKVLNVDDVSLIVTAVNHHDELRTRLENLVNQAELVREDIINQPRFPNLSTHNVGLHGLPEAIREARETLKKVIQ